MGWFDDAKSLIKSAYNYVVGNDTDTKATTSKKETKKASKTPVSIHNPQGKTVGTVGDTLETKQTKTTKTTKQTTKTTKAKTTKSTKTTTKKPAQNTKKNQEPKTITKDVIEQKIADIENKCKQFNISFEDAKKNILEKMEFSPEKFSQESLETQYRILSCIDAALTMHIMYKKQGEVAEDIDKEEFIALVTKNYYDVITNGGIEDIMAFQQAIDTVLNEALVKYKDAKTDEEKAQILNEALENIKNKIQNDFNKEKVGKTETEKAKLEKQHKTRMVASERAFEYGFLRQAPASERKYSVYTRSGKYMAEAYQNQIDISANEVKSEVAGSQTHEFSNNVLKFKYSIGDYVPADIYGDAIGYSMQYKSLADAKQFEQDAFIFRQKVENGEIDAPWLTQEHFTAESTAIGVGITNNRNMSSAEKAELLNTWDKHASQFGDYCDVKAAYNKAIDNETNPNSAQDAKNVKKILIENYNNDIERMPKAWKKRQEENPAIKQKASEATLKAELKTKSIEEIQKSYSNTTSEIARIVLSNDVEYKNRIDDILGYLKGYSGEEIGFMAIGCSTHTISKIIQAFPEKAKDILDVVAPTMCFAGKKAVERIVEDKKDNEAA